MTEFTGLDMEMTFKDNYHEVLDMLEKLFLHIFKGINERCPRELEAVRAQYPFANLKFGDTALRLRYQEAVALLREHGPAIGAERLAVLEAQQQAAAAAGDGENARDLAQQVHDAREHLKTVPGHADDEDISTKDEKLLGAIISRVKGTDFYVIDKFPRALRPFYTMADPDDPKWSNSYDIFIRGEEVTSGAQRIHDPQMLLDNAKQLGVDLTPIQDYVDSFQYGAFPHAGGGIGMERVVMLFLSLDNIRKSSMFPRGQFKRYSNPRPSRSACHRSGSACLLASSKTCTFEPCHHRPLKADTLSIASNSGSLRCARTMEMHGRATMTMATDAIRWHRYPHEVESYGGARAVRHLYCETSGHASLAVGRFDDMV